MDVVDLDRLTDIDFEAVCQDLFQEVLGTRLEIFAPGRDDGADLRAFSGDGQLVVQCKHWRRSGASALRRHVERVEAAKVKRLAPARYVLATSADLTKGMKDKLATALAPYVQSPDDIWGGREIVAELERRPEVVRRHVRLWFSSAEVLAGLLTKDIGERSRDRADDIATSLKVFVPHAGYDRARDLLDRERVCVLAGLPGIGKTTLVHALAAEYATRGYEIVAVSQDVSEVDRAWVDGRRQLFHYDDFLGQNALHDTLPKNEDARLLRVLDRVAATPDKRFVLTTRDYILAQAKQQHERLSRREFTPLRCVVDLADYTSLVRAEILYNHVYFSSLDDASRRWFALPEAHRPIVEHRNFSPRLVAWSPGRSLRCPRATARHSRRTPSSTASTTPSTFGHISSRTSSARTTSTSFSYCGRSRRPSRRSQRSSAR